MFFQEAAGSVSIAEWVARELGSILNVKKMFFSAIDAEYHMSGALTFAPFDVTVDFATHRLRETLEPLAEVLGLSVDDLVKQFVAARPTASHFHKQETTLNLVPLN